MRRFIWTLTFVSCCILFVLTMSTQYHHYQSNPTLTVYDVMEDNPLRFPGFTVCNHNPFKRSYIESIPHMAEALEMIYPPFDDRRDFNVSNSTYYTSTEHLNFTALLDEGSFTVDEMMKECKFNNVIQNCSEIFSVVDTDIGRCFTFNSYSTIQKRREMFANDPEATDLEKRGRFFSVQPGAKYNLVLRLHAHQEEYYYGPYASPGYKVIAHCPYQYPPVSDIGISISPGMESYLAVALSWVYNLPAPFDAGCETIDGIYDSLDFHTFYSEGSCYMETLTKLTIEKCGCKYFLHKGIGRDCGLEEMGRCFFPLERDFKSGLYPINCPILCEYDHYDNAVSSAQFPSQYVAQKLSENFNRSTEEYSDNIMTLSVYFEELKYTVIKKIEAYPLTQLGADLGGMFGLCVGASVLTILEFSELFGNAVYGGCKKLVQKRMAVMSVSK